MLTDTHCHLDFDRFDADREKVIDRAQQAGVVRILVPGTNLPSSAAAVELAQGHSNLFAAVGIHPTEANSFTEDSLSTLKQLANNPNVKAFGEIGLDYYWDAAAHDLQKSVLQKQIDLAAMLELPVVIHMREKGDAPDGPCASDLLDILEKWISNLPAESRLRAHPGVLHSYSGNLETARKALQLQFKLGITGPVTYRPERQELIKSLPLASLLLETDSPFLAPQPHRGERNEPAFVALIADTIGVLHSLPAARITEVTGMNAAHLFNW